MNEIESFSLLMKHMKEEHPESDYFGDSGATNWATGEVVSQKCQICGKELVDKGKETNP